MAETSKGYEAKIKSLKGSEIEIEGEIDAAVLEAARKAVLEEARKDMVVPGFRKGNVPDVILLQRVNEAEVMNEAAEIALNELYPQILKDNTIDALGLPEITITKLAKGNPLGFKARVGVIPEIKLGDYLKTAKKVIDDSKKEKIEVKDEELTAVIDQVKRLNAGKDQAGDANAPLPELTDEMVKKLGKFENVEDFKNKLRDNILKEKEQNARKAVRNGIIQRIVESSKFDLPEIAVSREIADVHQRLLKELAEKNMTFEDYLKQFKRTEADIMAQHRAYVENSLRSRLVLDKIAIEQKITPDPKEVDASVEYLLTRNPESDRDYVRHYVETVLTNEGVIDYLEKEAEKTA